MKEVGRIKEYDLSVNGEYCGCVYAENFEERKHYYDSGGRKIKSLQFYRNDEVIYLMNYKKYTIENTVDESHFYIRIEY